MTEAAKGKPKAKRVRAKAGAAKTARQGTKASEASAESGVQGEATAELLKAILAQQRLAKEQWQQVVQAMDASEAAVARAIHHGLETDD